MFPLKPMKFSSLLLCCALSLAPLSAAAKGSVNSVPDNALLLLSMHIREEDPGQKWALDSLIRYLLSEAGKKQESEKLKEIKLFKFSDLSFSLLPLSEREEQQMLLIAELIPSDGKFGFTYGDKKLQLNIRDRKTAKNTQKGLLSFMLGIVCDVPPGSEPDGSVFYNPRAEKRENFSAFYVGDGVAMMASNKGIIKSALSEKSGLASTPTFKETMELLPRGWDAYGYARGKEILLPKSPGKRWQAFIFTLLKGVKRLGLALDIQDKNHSRLALVLTPENPGKAKELRERLEPQLNLLIKQYFDESIKSTIMWEDLPAATRVHVQLDNTFPFWCKLLHLNCSAP